MSRANRESRFAFESAGVPLFATCARLHWIESDAAALEMRVSIATARSRGLSAAAARLAALARGEAGDNPGRHGT